MKRLILMLFIMAFLYGCFELPEYAGPEEVSPSPSSSPSILIPPGPASRNIFSLPWAGSLKPIENRFELNDNVISLCYEGLFVLDEIFEPQPILCDKWDNEENIRYTLYLRPNVTFHNGKELTANDVIFSFERAISADSPYAQRFDQVQACNIIDDFTFEIILKAPNHRFIALLDFPIVAEYTDDIGTGPYQIKEEEGEHYLLTYSEWWQKKSMPVQRIELIEITETEDLVYSFNNKYISLVAFDPHEPLSPGLHSDFEKWEYPTSTMVYIGINTAVKPFDLPEMRKVLSLALDRQQLGWETYGNNINITALPVPPVSKLYRADSETLFSYNIEEAADMLSKLVSANNVDNNGILKYTKDQFNWESLEVDIIVNIENTNRQQMAQSYAQALTALGIQTNVRILTWNEYTTAIEAGDYTLFFGETRLSADFSLSPLMSNNGSLNPSGYNDSKTDILLDELAQSPQSEHSFRYAQLYRNINDMTPFMVIGFRDSVLYAQRGLIKKPSPVWRNTFYHFYQWEISMETR